MLVRSVMTSTMMVMGRPTRVGSTVAAWPVITPSACMRLRRRCTAAVDRLTCSASRRSGTVLSRWTMARMARSKPSRSAR